MTFFIFTNRDIAMVFFYIYVYTNKAENNRNCKIISIEIDNR